MATPGRYHDRSDAGRVLAAHLAGKAVGGRPVVVGLPRGGVPVAFEVAIALKAPLDIFLVRKLGLPGQTELAMGALASGGAILLDHDLIARAGVSRDEVRKARERAVGELEWQETFYRTGRRGLDLAGRSVVVVDDGLATGYTMRTAIVALRQIGAARITVAVPVGARDTCIELSKTADLLVCPLQPECFHSVGLWYQDFSQVGDDEVKAYLRHAAETVAVGAVKLSEE